MECDNGSFVTQRFLHSSVESSAISSSGQVMGTEGRGPHCYRSQSLDTLLHTALLCVKFQSLISINHHSQVDVAYTRKVLAIARALVTSCAGVDARRAEAADRRPLLPSLAAPLATLLARLKQLAEARADTEMIADIQCIKSSIKQ